MLSEQKQEVQNGLNNLKKIEIMKTFTVVSENNTKTKVEAFTKEDAKQKVMKSLRLHWSQIIYVL